MEKLISILLFSSFLFSQDTVFSSIREQAVKKGLPEAFLIEAFSSEEITIHNDILERFAKPYEKKSWTDYRKLFVTKSRITAGNNFYQKNEQKLIIASNKTKVDLFLILSIIGVESNYGRHRGKYNVFNALYTQIAKMPRRSKWAKKEMIEYLLYCYKDKVSPHSILGSYAGAFGYGQFIPSSYNTYAIDGNDDGIRKPYDWSDVFASIGNYLVKNGYPTSDPTNKEKVYKSIYAYNHADNYVKAVIELRNELEKSILTD
jgi:membrane-bound lytic murein transglycosylase B